MKFLTFGLFAFLSFFVVSCLPGGLGGEDQKSELQYFKVSAGDFKAYINDKPMPKSPDLGADKTIINRDYPIEIALYEDGKWFYDLPNLDTGSGTWTLEEGVIKLFAKQRLFDMHIDIVATQAQAKEVVLKFRDRFGQRVLDTEKINFLP